MGWECAGQGALVNHGGISGLLCMDQVFEGVYGALGVWCSWRTWGGVIEGSWVGLVGG